MVPAAVFPRLGPPFPEALTVRCRCRVCGCCVCALGQDTHLRTLVEHYLSLHLHSNALFLAERVRPLACNCNMTAGAAGEGGGGKGWGTPQPRHAKEWHRPVRAPCGLCRGGTSAPGLWRRGVMPVPLALQTHRPGGIVSGSFFPPAAWMCCAVCKLPSAATPFFGCTWAETVAGRGGEGRRRAVRVHVCRLQLHCPRTPLLTRAPPPSCAAVRI
jgi:hypothetical protein